MVFEGGGAKGMAFVGSVAELEAQGHSPARLIGTSAGAITATLLAAGYDANEMAKSLCETQEDGQPVFLGFLEVPPRLTREAIKNSSIRALLKTANMKFVPDFLEDRLDDGIANLLTNSPLIGRVCSFIELGGIFAADSYLDWLEGKLDSGIYQLERGNFGKNKPRAFGNLNLAEYYEATGAELSLVASDTSDSRMLVLNHNTAPDCPVKWAARMSMSFPLLWHEVVWQSGWGSYMGNDITGHTVVDGGLLSNFPIELFLSNQERITKVMGEKNNTNASVLGFLIDEMLPLPDALVEEKSGRFNFADFKPVQRVINLINTMTQAHDKMAIEAYEDFVIRLPAKGYGTVEFGMSDERRDALVEAGRIATRDYFNRKATQIETPSDFEEPLSLEMADRIATRILYT